MVSFTFTPEQEKVRNSLIEFNDRVLLPGYIDRASSSEFPFETLRQLADLGVLGIGLPEHFGGTGGDDPVLLGVATEAIARGDVNLASAPIQIGLVGAQLMECAPAVQERYLPPLIRGEITLAIALTEPGSGSDAGALVTTATRVDGGWLVKGEKTAISWAMNASAAVVYAREPGTSRSRGVSAFLVPLDADGVTVTHLPGMGCLPLGLGSIRFDDVFVPEDHLVGEAGRGFHAAMHHFDFSRAALGLLCLGAAQQSLDEAVVHAQQRETFGQPLAEHQGLAFGFAEHATYLEGARWMCYRALALREGGQPHTAIASMSKWWPPIIAKNAIEFSMRVHGNLGYLTQSPLQQRFRDVLAYLIADGTSEIQKRVIAKEIFARSQILL